MPGPNPTLRFGIEMTPESRQVLTNVVNDLKGRLRELERTRGKDDPEVQRYREILKNVKATAEATEQGSQKARNFARELGGVAGALRNLNVLGGAGGAAAGGIMGVGGALLAGGGVLAAVTAITAVVGMAMKMALEFERTSTRAAQALSVGSTNFRSNYDAVRRASFDAGQPYGIGVGEMAGAIAAYGLSSGATGVQAGRSAGAIARYARGYGMDPTQLASMVGGFSASTGEGFETTASALFGGAEGAGPLGRRLTEFIGAATNVLTTMQMQNPNGTYGAEDAASLVRNIARLGGIFSTGQGVQMFTQASSSLTGGTSTDIRKMAFAVRAGITNPLDLILGPTTISPADYQRRMASQAIREGGPLGSAGFAATLLGLTGSEDAARTLFAAYSRNGGVQSLYNTHSAGPAPIDRRVNDYLQTPLAAFDRVSAHLENTMTKWGDNINNLVAGPLKQIDDALDKVSASGGPAAKAVQQVGTSIDFLYQRIHGGWSRVGFSDAYYGGSGPGGVDYGHPFGPGSASGIGPYAGQVNYDISHGFDPRSRHGISKNLFSILNSIRGMNYNLGIYAVTSGEHSSGSRHYTGDAMDVDTVNGRAVGSNFATDSKFARDVLMADPHARIGTYKKLYDWLVQQGFDSNQVFQDEGSGPHIHIDDAANPARSMFGDFSGQGTSQTTVHEHDKFTITTTTKVTPKAGGNHAPAGPSGSIRRPGTRGK